MRMLLNPHHTSAPDAMQLQGVASGVAQYPTSCVLLPCLSTPPHVLLPEPPHPSSDKAGARISKHNTAMQHSLRVAPEHVVR